MSSCSSSSPKAKEAKYFNRAEALIATKDYARAILELRNAVSAAPDDAEPYYRLGMVFLASGDQRTAARMFQKAAELNPRHTGAQLKLAELMTVSGNKYLDDAVTRVKGVLEASPNDPEALDTLAIAEWKLGNQDEAAQRLQEALSKSPAHLQSSITLARMKLNQNDRNGAEQVLRRAVTEAPRSSLAAQALGELYILLRQPAKAEAALQRAFQLDPRNGAALMDIGGIRIAANRIGEAEPVYKQLAALPDKTYRPIHAIFLYQTGKREAAVAELESLAKADPGDREIRNRLVAAYFGMNRATDAENVLAAALKRDAKDTDALLQRAELRLRVGKTDDAEQDLRQVLHYTPNSAAAHALLASAFRAKGLVNTQRQELQQALRLDAAFLPARLALETSYLTGEEARAALETIDGAPDVQKKQLAWILAHNWALLAQASLQEARTGIEQALKLGQPPQAIYQNAMLHFLQHDYRETRAQAEALLQRGITDISVLDLMMESYAAQKEIAKGVMKLKEIVGAHPGSAPLQNLLGEWYLRTGDSAEAQKAYEAAIAADEHFVPAQLSLAQIDIEAGRNDEAARRLKAVIAADPTDIPALLLSARADMAAGSNADVISAYRTVLNIDSSNPTALNNLAYLLAVDNADEALKLAQKAAEVAPDSPIVQDTLGWIYYRKGLYSIAVRYLKTAVDKDPNPRRQFHLAMSYLKVGDQTEGRKIMREALLKDPSLAKTEQGW
jgi:tetratricopeptide (TPR) repeat protein